MIRCDAILRSAFHAFWYLVQTECIVATVRWIGVSVHQKSIAKRWIVPRNANVEIVVFLGLGRD